MPQERQWFRVAAGAMAAPVLAAASVWWAARASPLSVAVLLGCLSAAAILAIVLSQRASARRSPHEQRQRERANLAFGWGLMIGGAVGLCGALLGVPWLESAQLANVVIASGGSGLVAGARARLSRLDSAM